MRQASFVTVWQAALADLERRAPPPLLVIVGDQPHLKQRLLEAAGRGHGGEKETFSQRPGEKDGRALDRLLDDWSTASLFGGQRLIVARAADALLKGKGAARLGARLAAGEPPHRLLLTLKALDGRTRLAKQIKSSGGLISLPVMRDAPPPWHTGGPLLRTDLNEWLVLEARFQGLELDLPVAAALHERIGNEPGTLAQTVTRLGLLLDDGATKITLADVERHVPHTSARLLSRYEDALREGRLDRALELVDRMTRDGVYDPFMKLVAGSLVGETILRGLSAALAREVCAHDALGSELIGSLRVPPWKRDRRAAGALDEALGQGGRRVFLERDLRRTPGPAARRGFRVALDALRAQRDGEPPNLHALSVRLARALASAGSAS